MYKSMTKKQKKMFKRIILAAFFTLPCFFIPEKYLLVRGIAFLVSYAIAGNDIIFKALRNIKNGQIFDENLLMCIATIGAYTLAEFSEAVMVVLLYQVGELFQSCAVSKSRKSIAALMDIRPDYANIIKDDGSYDTVNPESINIGDIILIKSGERIPLDCEITEGSSEVDTSSLTGESVPSSVNTGDLLISGSVNISGMLKAKVIKTYGDSTVSKILELTEHCAERKSKSVNFIAKFARYYTPIVCILALCMAIIPTALGGSFAANLKRSLIFLVVSCPCALVISVPLSFFCGIGCASKNGILIKGANYIEALAGVDTVIFDKTGTLTCGKFSVVSVESYNNYAEKDILRLAAAAEFYSDHPIAMALKSYAEASYTKNISESHHIIGKGVYAKYKEANIYVGNSELMHQIGIPCDSTSNAYTQLYVAINENLIGTIHIADSIKPDTEDALDKLKNSGIKHTVMLTGDKKAVAESIAALLGISEVHSELLPGDKVRIAEEIIKSNKKKKTVFAGDGINDAPVLSIADVGIAMGAMGSDAAIEAADVVIMDDKLSKIPTTLRISKKTMSIVYQNIVLAIGIKVAVMILSAFGITDSMWLAIFADVGVAIIAILNALRTFHIKQ